MTRHEDCTPMDRVLAMLSEEGFDGMAQAIALLMNEAMKIERSAFLRAEPHERSEDRRGQANGYKRSRVRTRVGEVELRVPQVRDVADGAAFYAQSLERGQCSERALRLAVPEMYVQGVSADVFRAAGPPRCSTTSSTTRLERWPST